MSAGVAAEARAGALAADVRSGPGHWWASFTAMVRWHLVSLRLWLGVLAVIQVLSGVGFVLGIGLFFDPIPLRAALFVSTGVPVINLLMVGLVLGPQLVADQRMAGSFDFVHALPVPLTAAAFAWYVVTLIGGVPAVVVALAVAAVRYDGLPLVVSPAVVPAVLLVTWTGTMLGYAIAHAISSPMVTRLATQLIVFGIFGVTPILFPVTQMPAWLGTVNWWLPFRHMADVVRAALTDLPYPDLATSYLVLVIWGTLCGALAVRSLGRRG